jgi:8-amino-3,8-dideoxy-alpha-D-manno-octulosonate transaminase
VRTLEALALDGGEPVRREPLALGKGVALLGEDERAAVLEVLESRSLFRYYGPALQRRTAAFEAAVAERFGVAHAVATSSGTAALRTALAALGIGCGDEVIVPAFTFIATVNAVVIAGAVPVFAEVDESLGLDAADVAGKITPRTAAIIGVHIENVACDLDAVTATAAAHDLAVIEDAAQAMGATYHGRALGTIGDIGTFSLQLEKNVTAGEGGVVVTNDERLYARSARYQDQGGQFFTGHHGGRGDDIGEAFVGENLRMTEIAAAIAGVQLDRLPGLLASLRANKQRVLRALGDRPGLTRRRLPDPDGDGSSSATWFAADAASARWCVDALRAEGVPSAQMYAGLPVYANPAILERRTASMKGGPWHCAEHPADVDYRMGMCPRTEDLASRSFTIGIGATWTPADCDDAATAVAKVASHLSSRGVASR